MNTAKSASATHKRLKTGEQVIVSREYDIVIVRNLRGKVLGSYERTKMATFYKRYEKITVKGR